MLPPMRGGLPDHTARLAIQLSQHFDITVITSVGATPQSEYRVEPVIEQWADTRPLEKAIAIQAVDSPILWQYVPHMYGRGGVNRELPRLMSRLRRRGKRQIVIAHEIAAGLSWRPHWLWFALNHRWQWQAIVRVADAIPISTERWVEQWKLRLPEQAHKFSVLPSPSSIPLQPVIGGHAARWRSARQLSAETRVLAYFGTVSPAKQLPWVISAWQAAQTTGAPTALAIIGAAPTLEIPSSLQALYRPLGFLSAPEVSYALSATDVLCLPFVDGVSERRTTLMAGLDHSVAITGTYGHNTGTTLKGTTCLTLCSATDREAFVRQTREMITRTEHRQAQGAEGKKLHDQRFSWSVVTKALVERISNVAIGG